MRYWWVNQNKTYRHEVPGGYLWSPKRKANRGLNPFYEFMREVSPGDLVFSFYNTRIPAFGIARSYAYEAPKPDFGTAGRNWSDIGWRVDVAFHQIHTIVRPVDWIEHLRPDLPMRYSPLQQNGRGQQGVYLTELPRPLALKLADIIGTDVAAIARSELLTENDTIAATLEVVLWEDHLRKEIEGNSALEITERRQLVLARIGQGRFRESVQQHETHCRVTRVDRIEHLRASHCKPWRDSNNQERLDSENGLLLTPSIDHLFDRGFISFQDQGKLLISPVAHRESLHKMGVPVDGETNVDRFRVGQSRFLEYHRDEVFLKSRLRRA